MNAYNTIKLTKTGAPIHVKIRSAKKSPDAPAKARDFISFFSEEMVLERGQGNGSFSCPF